MSKRTVNDRSRRPWKWKRILAIALIPVLGYLFLPFVGTNGSGRNLVGIDDVILLVEVFADENQSLRASAIDRMSQDEFVEWLESSSFDPYRGRDVFLVDHVAWTQIHRWPLHNHVHARWDLIGKVIERSGRPWDERFEEFPPTVLKEINDLIVRDLLTTTGVPHGDQLTQDDLNRYGPRFRASINMPPPGGEVLNQLAHLGIIVVVTVLMLRLGTTS